MVNLLVPLCLILLGLVALLLRARAVQNRRLKKLTDNLGQLDIDTLAEPPTPISRRNDQDAVSELEQAVNDMRLRLLNEARALQQTVRETRERKTEAEHANNAKTLFLANVSHELRIPLQSISGYATLLTDTALDQEQREYVNTVISASESLSAIIRDLLDISSVEAGKLDLTQAPVDLRDTLNDVVHMLGNRAREKGLALEVRIDETLPWAVTGDPVRLRQIMLNLLSNAIKFTDSGHVLMSIEVLGRDGDQVRLRLSVEDTGIGISPDNIQHIYDPYVTFGNRAQGQLPGAGLGLTICKQLVELMGGSLNVESSPGEGSTFWLELNLGEATDGIPRARPDSSQVQGRRLLVLDAYALSRKITLEVLSRYPVHIDAVGTAGEALAALGQAADANAPYHAVIMDGFVPDMESELLCRQIRGNPQWQDLKLLILSSNPQRGDAEHFREVGADAFLSKTLRESYLVPLLNQLFTDSEQAAHRFLTRFSLQPSSEPGQRKQELPCGNMRVLLVEDNPVNRTLTQRMLEKLGCDVMTANDGKAASRLWQWHTFDLVLMDCVMPQMDGFEATRELRDWELRHHRERVPVVALTASATEQDEDKCRQAGMNSLLAKPVNNDMLRAVLEQYCPTCEEP